MLVPGLGLKKKGLVAEVEGAPGGREEDHLDHVHRYEINYCDLFESEVNWNTFK